MRISEIDGVADTAASQNVDKVAVRLDRRDYWIPIGSAPHAEPEGGYQVPEPPLSQKAEPPFPTRFLKSMARLFERR